MSQDQEILLWKTFATQHALTEEQTNAFQTYCQVLLSWNEKSNITALDTVKQVIHGHFDDSLAAAKGFDFSTISGIVDAGSGGGFPGIPLKIKYPHLFVVLVEVNHKKIAFLNEVITVLGLTGIEVYGLDWRTFLRKTDHPIDLVCARASLPMEELLRIFKPSSPYKTGKLVYWASQNWEPTPQVEPYVKRAIEYKAANKKRKLVTFSL